jgi:hypothetical protein
VDLEFIAEFGDRDPLHQVMPYNRQLLFGC